MPAPTDSFEVVAAVTAFMKSADQSAMRSSLGLDENATDLASWLASPSAIGGTTAASATFTTLAAQSITTTDGNVEISNTSAPAGFVIKGDGLVDTSGDADQGVSFNLNYNRTGNRQFIISPTDAGGGVRYIMAATNSVTLDGYNQHTNDAVNLVLGSGSSDSDSSVSVGNSADSTTLGVGALKVAGGVSVAKILRCGSSIIADNLPTADPVISGALWNDSGTLKVSAG